MASVPEIKLDMHVKQTMRLSLRMLQSTRILQMDVQELREFANGVLEENPLLEYLPEQNSQRELQELRCSAPWLGASGRAGGDEQYRRDSGVWDTALTSISAVLMERLERMSLPQPLRELCRYFIQALDENGYLEQEDIDAVVAMGVPERMAAQAVELLQGMEPAGIAARDLRECLLLQLRRLPQDTAVAECMVRDHLELLGKKRWHMLANALHTDVDTVRQAAELIGALSPHPGRTEGGDTAHSEYIIPDAFVVEMDGTPQLVLNDYYVPRLGINASYARMLEQEDTEAREFIQGKMRQARWVIDCLERRRRTLERCAQLILETHLPFFRGETPYLVPLTQKEAAARLDMHASTVSRCIRGKYLQCRQGTYPLQYFFPRPVDEGGCCSEQAVRTALARHLRDEDPAHPLSDRQLGLLLAEEGFPTARRTVAKYRQLLGIPPAYGRKK